MKYFDTPFWIKTIVNYDCQCNCEYCYFSTRDLKQPMSAQTIYAILLLAYYSKQQSGLDFSCFESNMYNNNMDSYVVSLELTEPLLNYTNIRDGILLFLTKTNLTKLPNLTILTNGIALTQEMMDFFNNLHITLMISIDGYEDEQRGYDQTPIIEIIRQNPKKCTLRTVIKDQDEEKLLNFLSDMSLICKDIITQTECRTSPTLQECNCAEKIKKSLSKNKILHLHEDPFMPTEINPNFMHSPTLQIDTDGEMSLLSGFVPPVLLGNINHDFQPDLFTTALLDTRKKEVQRMNEQRLTQSHQDILISHFLGTKSIPPDPYTLKLS